MKIAALLHYYIEEHGSGGELYAHGLLKELAKKHHVAAFITSDNLPDNKIDGVNVHYNGSDGLREAEFDILITHFNNTAFSQAVARERGIPLVTIVHNNMQTTKRLMHTNPASGLIIYNSHWIKRDINQPGIVLHPITKRVKASPGDKVLLVNLVPAKGSQTFFQLAREMPDVEFLGVKGGYYKSIQEHVDLPNLEIIENVSDMNTVYSRTKIVLMPSTYESYGMVASEAAQAGIPSIVHPTPGLLENLGDAGIYVYSDDVEGYKQAIYKLLKDKSYYNERSKLAKKRSIYHAETSQINETIKAIEELV